MEEVPNRMALEIQKHNERVLAKRERASKIDYRKQHLAALRGMAKLKPRIEELRKQLEPLQDAYLRLLAKKQKAEYELAPVTQIPIGMNGKKALQNQERLINSIDSMSESEMDALMSQLQRRLKK